MRSGGRLARFAILALLTGLPLGARADDSLRAEHDPSLAECSECESWSAACENDPVPHQASCYCAAACACACSGEAECAEANSASAAKLGTQCNFEPSTDGAVCDLSGTCNDPTAPELCCHKLVGGGWGAFCRPTGSCCGSVNCGDLEGDDPDADSAGCRVSVNATDDAVVPGKGFPPAWATVVLLAVLVALRSRTGAAPATGSARSQDHNHVREADGTRG